MGPTVIPTLSFPLGPTLEVSKRKRFRERVTEFARIFADFRTLPDLQDIAIGMCAEFLTPILVVNLDAEVGHSAK
jgi:hypothetical protein